MNEHSNSLSQQLEDTAPTLRNMASCIRKASKNSEGNPCPSRRVTFPDEDSKLITGYMEPPNPWEYDCASTEELISLYKASCQKHCTEPLPKVLGQLQEVDLDLDRNESFSLKGELMNPIQFEPLEEILKRIQFKNIDVEATALNDESSVALFDMLEYYESANYLNISSNADIGSRGWHACSRMIKKTQSLERLDAKNVVLNEQHMPILARALRITTQLQVLKLENCWLSGRPIIILAAALRLNTGIKELYLADNDLGITDAIHLAGLLRSNHSLQLLDVSNNNIQDAGVGHISDGLVDQVPSAANQGVADGGLSILVLWNNRLTRNCSKHFARALSYSKSLGILNIGHNVLTNECLHVIKDSLQQNRTLLRLGMQSTHLTCEGAIALAECIADHPVIQRIDLRDNNLEVAGLMALTLSMKVNSSVTQLDVDDTPKKKLENAEAEQYRRLVSEIRGYCTRNEEAPQEDLDTVEEEQETPKHRVRLQSINSRKISLTCETLLRSVAPQQVAPQFLAEPKRSGGRLRSPAPSPIPSPISSPLPSPSRNRFSVSKVPESAHLSPSTSESNSPVTPPSTFPSQTFFPSPSNSRFQVSKVVTEPCPALVTSPSGNNVTLGFVFDVKTVSSSNDASSLSLNPSITNDAPSIPEIYVRDTSFDHKGYSQDISVTVKQGSVIEDKTDGFEDPDSEVKRIMDNADLAEKLESDSNIMYQKWNGFTDQNPFLNDKPDDRLVARQEDFPIVPQKAPIASTSSQRSRKISWVAPQSTEDRLPTSLERLIGLFNPSGFFNKSQQQYRSNTIPEQQSVENIFPLLSDTNLTSLSVEKTIRDDLTKLSSDCSSCSPLPDFINNNNDALDVVTSMFSRNISVGDSGCSEKSDLDLKEDENFNVHLSLPPQRELEKMLCSDETMPSNAETGSDCASSCAEPSASNTASESTEADLS